MTERIYGLRELTRILTLTPRRAAQLKRLDLLHGKTGYTFRELLALRAAAALVVALALMPAGATAADPTWEAWLPIPGVLDLDGPRADGTFVVAGSAALYTLDATGNVQPFARGPGGYHEDAGQEAYLALSPGSHVEAADCDFGKDETFILRLHVPFGINRVDADGSASGSFANIAGLATLTTSGMLVGTPLYMAPEGMSDPSGVDARADLFALGAVG